MTGGQVSHLNLPFASARVLAISLVRHSLLVADRDRRLFDLQLASLTLRQIPLPRGASPAYAAWDPAGKRIAFSIDDRLTVFDPWKDTEPIQSRLPGRVIISGWDTQGLGLRFAIYDTKTEATRWWELTGTARAAHLLPRLSPNPSEPSGAWSLDGRFFAFQAGNREVEDQWRIWVAEGNPPRSYPLTADARSWKSPTFVPGSNTILAAGGQSQGQLVTFPVSGGETTLRPVLPGVPAYELDYSRDGRWIAYTLFPEHSLWRCRIDGSEPRQLSPSGMEAHQPHWSPDGARIAFMGKRASEGARWRVYLVPSAGGGLDEPLPDGDDEGVPSWSPDGGSLVFGDLMPASGFERAAIHELDLQTGAVATIAAPMGMWSPRMSPDGKYLAAVSHDNKSLCLRDNLRKTWRVCATMNFLEEASWPLDSSWIQFIGVAGSGERDLFRVSPACEPPRQVVDLTALHFLGATWFGIAPDHSPTGLLRFPNEIYALDWRLRRRIP